MWNFVFNIDTWKSLSNTLDIFRKYCLAKKKIQFYSNFNPGFPYKMSNTMSRTNPVLLLLQIHLCGHSDSSLHLYI